MSESIKNDDVGGTLVEDVDWKSGLVEKPHAGEGVEVVEALTLRVHPSSPDWFNNLVKHSISDEELIVKVEIYFLERKMERIKENAHLVDGRMLALVAQLVRANKELLSDPDCFKKADRLAAIEYVDYQRQIQMGHITPDRDTAAEAELNSNSLFPFMDRLAMRVSDLGVMSPVTSFIMCWNAVGILLTLGVFVAAYRGGYELPRFSILLLSICTGVTIIACFVKALEYRQDRSREIDTVMISSHVKAKAEVAKYTV